MDLWLQIALSLLSFLGVVISAVGFPGFILIFLVLVATAFLTNFEIATVTHILWFGAISILSSFVDNIAVVLGAKKYGASKYGMVGAFVGGIMGLLLIGPMGILVGPFVGAVLAEYLFNADFKKSLGTGFGTFVGYVLGMFLKLLITISLFIWLMWIIW